MYEIAMKKCKHLLQLSLVASVFVFSGCNPDDLKNNQNKGNSNSANSGSTQGSEIVRSYGYAGNELGFDLLNTGDGGYLMTGYTEAIGAGMRDMYLFKINADGDQMWAKTFGDIDNDEGHHIIKSGDGAYMVVGSTRLPYTTAFSDEVYLIKVDTNGNEIWNKKYGGTGSDIGNSIIKVDDGYVIVGSSTSYDTYGTTDMLLLKVSKNGDTSWPQIFAFGERNVNESGNDVVATDDNGLIAVGNKNTGLLENQLYIVKTDSNGNKLWEKTVGSTTGSTIGYSIVKTANNEFVIAGSKNSDPWNKADHLMLMKINTSGTVLWEKIYDKGVAYDVSPGQNGDGFVLVGYTSYIDSRGAGYSRPIVVEVNSHGEKISSRIIDKDMIINPVEVAKAVTVTNDGSIAMTGYHESNGSDFNLLFAKYR